MNLVCITHPSAKEKCCCLCKAAVLSEPAGISAGRQHSPPRSSLHDQLLKRLRLGSGNPLNQQRCFALGMVSVPPRVADCAKRIAHCRSIPQPEASCAHHWQHRWRYSQQCLLEGFPGRPEPWVASLLAGRGTSRAVHHVQVGPRRRVGSPASSVAAMQSQVQTAWLLTGTAVPPLPHREPCTF